MRILDSIELALNNILASKMRTFLTMLGIIIGVAAVIVITGLGNGLENYVTESFASLGTNKLTVMVSARGSTRTLDPNGFYEIVEECSEYLELCSPNVSINGRVKIGSETLSTSATGVSEEYLELEGLAVTRGRGLHYGDILQRAKVCVIGAYLNQAYFGGNAIGQTLRVAGESVKIVGVLEQIDDTLEEGGSDDRVYLPYSTVLRWGGTVSNYSVSARDEASLTPGQEKLEEMLEEFFQSDDFYTVINMADMLETMTSMIGIIVGVLAGIAAISLLVGGIGIMNIMLVSVTERTREIGIRKSLGAKERSIMQQFVIEAATTSALGGVLGILLGYGLSGLVTTVMTFTMEDPLTVAPSVGSVLIAFSISAGIGVLFGYLPAKKAAQLNPIDALRYD